MTSVNIVYFPGTNCHRETAFAFELAGAQPRIVFMSDVLRGSARFDDADIVCIPGGFAYGDHVRAGLAAALFLQSCEDQVAALRSKPAIFICNGMQIAAEAGLFGPHVALTTNRSGTFVHVADQAHVVEPTTNSLWLAGLQGETLRFPCAHGEGRFVFNGTDGWSPALFYPAWENPDGSERNVAGISSPDGLRLGLMDHPERNLRSSLNLEIFRNAVRFVDD